MSEISQELACADWDEYSPIIKMGAEQMELHPEWAIPILEIAFRQIAERRALVSKRTAG